MKKILFLAMISALAWGTAYSQTPESLRVIVQNLRSEKGQVGVLVFEGKDGYPSDHQKALTMKFTPVQPGETEVVFEDLSDGTYVVTVMHDENENNKMDKDLFGRPKEGYGVSQNPPNRTFGPPKFSEGMFDFQDQNRKIEIQLRYD